MSNYKTFNENDLKNHFDGDEELISEMVELFEETYQSTIADLKSSYLDENLELLERSSHTFKGMISNFFAEDLRQISSEIEELARNENLDGIEHKIEQIDRKLPEFLIEIKGFVGK